jgi:hypothetical protein
MVQHPRNAEFIFHHSERISPVLFIKWLNHFGYIEGPNGEIDWCIMDDDMDFDSFLSGIDTSGLLAMFHIFSMTACKLQR